MKKMRLPKSLLHREEDPSRGVQILNVQRLQFRPPRKPRGNCREYTYRVQMSVPCPSSVSGFPSGSVPMRRHVPEGTVGMGGKRSDSTFPFFINNSYWQWISDITCSWEDLKKCFICGCASQASYVFAGSESASFYHALP